MPPWRPGGPSAPSPTHARAHRTRRAHLARDVLLPHALESFQLLDSRPLGHTTWGLVYHGKPSSPCLFSRRIALETLLLLLVRRGLYLRLPLFLHQSTLIGLRKSRRLDSTRCLLLLFELLLPIILPNFLSTPCGKRCLRCPPPCGHCTSPPWPAKSTVSDGPKHSTPPGAPLSSYL